MAKRTTQAARGFGFSPAQSPHHFAVVVESAGGDVAIEERFTWGDAPDDDEAVPETILKARLDAYRWSRVAPLVADQFNNRLRAAHRATGAWAAETLLAPHLGKELTLLFWAVEDADPSLMPAMLANWVGLAPEERWWLYTTINATSGHPEHGRDRGWRKAIKIAFAENPVISAAPAALLSDAAPPRAHRPTQRRPRHALPPVEPDLDQPSLF